MRERGLVENIEASRVEDVSVLETWERLKGDPKAVLVDVRTRAEWAFVGIPDLSDLGREVLLIEWQTFPDSQVAADFPDRLEAALKARGIEKDDQVFFICRSGGRSRMAAEVMASAGYRRCWNVADGFEGPIDADRHRSQIAGWKFASLDWVQG
jgi:rhodanese-related sulfurtransferase